MESVINSTTCQIDNATYSNTSLGHAPRFTNITFVKISVLSVLFLVSLSANCAILVCIGCRRWRRRLGRRDGRGAVTGAGDQFSASSIDFLIGNLAASDLVVTFFCNVTDVIWELTVQWYAGNFACKLVKYVQSFGLYLSTYIVVVIAIDRCSAVLDPLSQKTRGRHRTRVLIGVSWLLSAIFSLPQVRTSQ